MNSANGPITELYTLYLRPLKQHWWIWCLPTVLFTGAAVVFALFGPQHWLASQQLVVRNESLGTQISLGRFESYDVMKTVEETIHAVAKNRHVAESVLQEVGPPEDATAPNLWPGAEDVDDFLACVSVTAPNGAIFGQTEVIHVNVKAESPDRAMALTDKLCVKLEEQLNKLRAERSAGMKRELEQAVALAEQELNQATEELATLERGVGADLSELRTMDQQVAGGAGTLTLELGRARENLQESKRQLDAIALRQEHLKKIEADPHAIVSVPVTVLASHATLAQLKTGLVNAELELAKVLSKYDGSHPRVRRIQEEVEQVQRRLKQEVAIAMAEADYDAHAMKQRITDLERVNTELRERIERIALIRVDYNRIQARVEQKKSDFASASSQLGEVEANERAALASSIINRIGDPVVSTHPIGPSKKIVVAGGALAGFAVGVGLVFLLIPATPHRVAFPHRFLSAGTPEATNFRAVGEAATDASSVAGTAVTQLANDVSAWSTTSLAPELFAETDAHAPVDEPVEASSSEEKIRPLRASSESAGSGTTTEIARPAVQSEVDSITVWTDPPVRPRRAGEVSQDPESEHDLMYQLHELRQEMQRGERPSS